MITSRGESAPACERPQFVDDTFKALTPFVRFSAVAAKTALSEEELHVAHWLHWQLRAAIEEVLCTSDSLAVLVGSSSRNRRDPLDAMVMGRVPLVRWAPSSARSCRFVTIMSEAGRGGPKNLASGLNAAMRCAFFCTW